MQHDDGYGGDGLAVPLRLHNLLLTFAGRIDDDALSEARELVARSLLDDAAELVAGTLIAGRIPVRTAEQRELALVLEISRSDSMLADQLTVSESVPAMAHRFTGEGEPDRGISEALARTIAVLPDLRSVHAVWRNTPAGAVSGPLPQRVVLVEIGAEGHPPAVAYRVDAALRRVGIRAAVEVSGPGAARQEYHDSAMTHAARVWLAGPGSGASGQVAAAAARGRHLAEVDTGLTGSQSQPVDELRAVRESERRSSKRRKSTPEPQTEPQPEYPVEPPEGAAEHTTELTAEENAQLKAALAEDPSLGAAIAGVGNGVPDIDFDDPQLSERDRKLLRELHAELAERERAEAAAARRNGAEPGERNW